MGSMMTGDVTCGTPMMIGMAFLAALLMMALALSSVAALKYLRSGSAVGRDGRHLQDGTGES